MVFANPAGVMQEVPIQTDRRCQRSRRSRTYQMEPSFRRQKTEYVAGIRVANHAMSRHLTYRETWVAHMDERVAKDLTRMAPLA